MDVQVLGERVLLKLKKGTGESAGGLMLPDGVAEQDPDAHWEVLSIGECISTVAVRPPIEVGDIVLADIRGGIVTGKKDDAKVIIQWGRVQAVIKDAHQTPALVT